MAMRALRICAHFGVGDQMFPDGMALRKGLMDREISNGLDIVVLVIGWSGHDILHSIISVISIRFKIL